MEPIAPASTSTVAPATNVPSGFQAMTTEDFVRIIFTELSHQDPFKPNDSGALLEQLNSIRSIESDLKLMERLDRLVVENQLASAGALVGKFISGLTIDNRPVDGFVIGITRNGESVNLELDTLESVPMNQVRTILDPSIFDEQPVDSSASVPQT